MSDLASHQYQRRVDYTNFYVSRIQELEEEVQALTIDLTSSRHRERSLHDTIEGFKQLQQDAARKRETADDGRDKMAEEVERLRRQVDALIDDNNSLRTRLKKFEDVATARVMKISQAVRGIHGGGDINAISNAAATSNNQIKNSFL